jgi:hypothetical protein
MFGRKSELERELAQRIGAERAADIVRDLGREIVNNPIIKRSPEVAAEALAVIARHRGPTASSREIAAEFVDGLMKQMGG